jgi:pilus assembly protein CpaD
MTRFSQLLLAGVAIASLGACAQSARQLELSRGAGREIITREVTAELKIDAIVSGERLGVVERDAVRFFAAAYMEEGHGALHITRPSASADDVASQRAAADARAVLLAEGVDAVRVTEGLYDASGADAAPLVLSYRTLETAIPDCPDISAYSVNWTGTNAPLPSFGCATAHNLAAMIADPSDLLGKQMMDAPDGARRSVVLSKYRNGEPTAAERNSAASGNISSAVN